MDFLLDTHALLYLLSEPIKIPNGLRAELETARLYLSAACTWEIAIKVRLSKLTIPPHFFDALDELNLIELPITTRHTREVMTLEQIHSDPFDRILIAQARTERLTIVTNDPLIARYPEVQVRW
jgi:PIN domain nuclease of toxin-antitoxin system